MSNSESKASFDPARFKEQERAGFNLVADRYENAMSLMTPVIERMLTLADLQPGQAVLDVATGPGIVARLVARQLGPTSRVVGVDLAEQAIEVARQRGRSEGLSALSFQVEDAENLSLAAAEFDRVICSMGLMHFPQPEKALLEMNRVLKPGGRLVAAVWGEAQDAPFIQVALNTLARNFPPPKVERPSMFRFGQPAVLERLISAAGFAQVQSERAIVQIVVPDASTYWKRFLDAAGITAVALAKQPPDVQAHLEADVATDLAPYRLPDGSYRLDSSIMLVTGIQATAS